MNIASQTRGKFFHLCVELDLSNSLHSKYLINGKNYHIEYEGLHMIYFTCERFGHTEGCVDKVHNVNGGVCGENTIGGQKDTLMEGGHSGIRDKGDGNDKDKDKTVVQGTPMFGPWMVVKKKKRTRRHANDEGRKVARSAHQEGQKGKKDVRGEGIKSRYKILVVVDIHDESNNNLAKNNDHTQNPMNGQVESSPKEFLSRSQIRRAKVLGTSRNNEKIQLGPN
ncbi:hypothetical protein Ahy_A05g025803 [Arachis hypogaea]|uniref:Zinc knuckle CX2CX4HX4C domain-containing protein n=1 Tax=Arachis hypogaea TaxID=3818 RepID=A0A445D9I2_ARAHY|nr:hypothetical protein Ahy_A05g025803 [Arachis hypogaea]